MTHFIALGRLMTFVAGIVLATAAAAAPSFSVILPTDQSKAPLTGRLIVVVAKNPSPEPRMAIGINGPAGFGVDVTAQQPGGRVIVGEGADGYPYDLKHLPAGDYYVQAIFIPYTAVHRADGHTLWLPLAKHLNLSFLLSGNRYSAITRVHYDPSSAKPVSLALTGTIAPDPEPTDSRWIKYVRMQSPMLSKFWGVPVYIGAYVLLPAGYDEHPGQRYPTVYAFGHEGRPFGFNADPASDTPGARAAAADANIKTGYALSQEWQSDRFPRMAAVTFELVSPYFFETYAANSANAGPYGDALTKEMIPFLEKKFRLIDAPWARVVEGASTGGWDTLSMQLHYPDFFGGAWVFNPDPVDFHNYQLVDIYHDPNMFTTKVNDWRDTDFTFKRTRAGQPILSVRELAALEAMLGSHGRSYFQLDAWQITHGPVGADGYPKPLFDKKTGVIDHGVANYMRDHGFDLTDYARRNWATLGPKLSGKLNIISGDMDDFFLNLGVYDFENMMRETAGPDYPVRFVYGRPKKGHNWHHKDWAGVLREMDAHFQAVAPKGEAGRWNY